MAHQVLARKWRPRDFSSLVGQDQIVTTLSNALTHNRLHHAYLFTGTRGVGKTTTARILAKCLNCEKGETPTPCNACDACTAIDQGNFIDLYEIDAASRTRVEDTRDILDNVPYAPSAGRYKIYLIDEVHMLSGHSFNALLKTLEEPPAHVKFLLATTDPQKLPATVLSRCLQFHLMTIDESVIADRLKNILVAENISADDIALHAIARAAKGSLRDALSLTDQAVDFGNGAVTDAETQAMLGNLSPTHLSELTQSLQSQDTKSALDIVAQLAQKGAQFSHVLDDLMTHIHEQMMAAAIGEKTRLTPAQARTLYQQALNAKTQLAQAPTPRIGFELFVLFATQNASQEVPLSQSEKHVSAISDTHTKKQAPATPQSNAAPHAELAPSPQSESDTPKQTAQTDRWTTLLGSLNLTGVTQAMATHCALDTWTETDIVLHMNKRHEPLLHPKRVERLNTAVSEHLKKTVRVTINITSDTKINTPHKTSEIQAKQTKDALRSDTLKDPDVQRIVQTFDANVIETHIPGPAPVEASESS